MAVEKLRILIVDANTASGRVMSDALADFHDIEVVASAAGNRMALAKLRQVTVDIVLFDMGMAAIDGLETLQKIRETYPATVVVAIVNDQNASQSDHCVKALQMGVVEFVFRPHEDENSLRDFRRQLRIITGRLFTRKSFKLAVVSAEQQSPLAVLSSRNMERELYQGEGKRVAVVREMPSRSGGDQPPLNISVVAIGISTGGPNALVKVIPKLPGDLRVPVLVVQHMPPLFTASLAASLDKQSALKVTEASHGQEVLPKTVYIAPGRRHMIVQQRMGMGERILLNDNPPVNSCRPSVDVLFQSLAQIYHNKVLAVIMTGMGNDGMQGVRAVKEEGGYCLIQTDETCVVYGMPKAVDEAGLSDEKVSLDNMADRIVALVRGSKEG